MEGVLLSELHCPTCGAQFTNFTPYVENAEEVFSVDQIVRDIKPAKWRRYLLCPNGHKWTIKTIWIVANEPGRVQLGEYLGTYTA